MNNEGKQKSNHKPNRIIVTIATVIVMLFYYGYTRLSHNEVSGYGQLKFGSSFHDVKNTHVCTPSIPIGIDGKNRNVNAVKYSVCDDYMLNGEPTRAIFEFIDGRLSEITIMMVDYNAWKVTLPQLAKQYGKPSRTVTDEDVEAQWNDSTNARIDIYFHHRQVDYAFTHSLGSVVQNLIVKSATHDDDISDVNS